MGWEGRGQRMKSSNESIAQEIFRAEELIETHKFWGYTEESRVGYYLTNQGFGDHAFAIGTVHAFQSHLGDLCR